MESAACSLLHMVQLVSTSTGACLTGRIRWLSSRATDAAENSTWKESWYGVAVAPVRADDEEVEDTLPVQGVPMPKARERVSVTRKARPSAVKAAPARRQSATAFQDELWDLITGLALRMDAIKRVPSSHNQASEAPSPFWHQYTNVAGNRCEAWDRDGLRQSTRASGRAQDVTHADGPASQSPDHAERFESRASSCTACRSDLITGKNRSRTGEREGTFVDGDR